MVDDIFLLALSEKTTSPISYLSPSDHYRYVFISMSTST